MAKVHATCTTGDLLSMAQQRQEEAVALLQDLVRIPSVNGRDDEAAVAQRAVTGHEWPAAGAGPANEGYMLIQAGIPTLCGFGPQGDCAHAPDEWVGLASLPQTIAMYAGIVRDYLMMRHSERA